VDDSLCAMRAGIGCWCVRETAWTHVYLIDARQRQGVSAACTCMCVGTCVMACQLVCLSWPDKTCACVILVSMFFSRNFLGFFTQRTLHWSAILIRNEFVFVKT